MSAPERFLPLMLIAATDTPPCHPAPAQARFQRWRRLCAVFFLGLFLGLPWIQWEQHQALLIDLSARQLRLFGMSLGTGEVIPVLCVMLAFAASFCAATTLVGRRWCGFGCPQTLMTRLFGRIEQLTTAVGFLRIPALMLRHALWIAISAWIGITFVGYFSPITGLMQNLILLRWSGWEIFWACFYAAATWGSAALLREQVCTYLCPYARMHNALRDNDTRGIRYDARRGEPRGQHAPNQTSVLQRSRGLLNSTTAADYAFRASYPSIAGVMPHFTTDQLGDCSDCGACHHACPAGLDIRAGQNPDCLECGGCIDACDAVMAGKGFPAGLLRIARKDTMEHEEPQRVRPKLLVAIVCIGVLILVGAGSRLF